MLSVRAILIATGMFAAVASAHATTVFDSMPSGSVDVPGGGYGASSSAQGPLGEQFFTGSATDLSSLSLYLSGDPTNAGGSLVVTIQADSSNAPSGTNLATLGTINDSQMAANNLDSIFTLTPSSTVQLSADTAYWVMLSDSSVSPATTGSYSGTSINWSVTSDLTDGTGVSGNTNMYVAQSVYTGSDLSGVFQMSVAMTSSQQQQPAPEPDGLALFGVGLLALGAVIRRRSQTGG